MSNWKQLLSMPQADDLEPLTRQLGDAGIPFQTSRDATAFSPTFSFSNPSQMVHLMVREEDVERAQSVLGISESDGIREAMAFLEELDEQELREVLVEDDRWSPEQVQAARLLLQNRGQNIDEARLQQEKTARIEALRQPKVIFWPLWLVMYVLALFGAPAAVVVFVFIYFFQGKDPAGASYHFYSDRDRLLALVGLIVGMGSWLIGFLSAGTWLGAGEYFSYILGIEGI